MNSINNFANTGELLDYQYQDHWENLTESLYILPESTTIFEWPFKDKPCRKLLVWANLGSAVRLEVHIIGKQYAYNSANPNGYWNGNYVSIAKTQPLQSKIVWAMCEWLDGIGWTITASQIPDSPDNLYAAIGVKIADALNSQPGNLSIKSGNQPALGIKIIPTVSGEQLPQNTQIKIFGVLEQPKQ